MTSFCAYGHSVYLTEGRSARDLPKQLPAKKTNFAKKFAAKAAWQIFFKQTCITKCICSHCLASCISERNPILYLAKPPKKTKVLIATNVADEQDGLEPQKLILDCN